jgi:sigma-B regulation protein RsbU (phosphoserine phosphatase)
MWNIHSTTRLLKEMSQSTEPGALVRLLFDHLRRSVGVQRALVLSNAGLSPPHYRLVHDVNCNDDSSGSVATIDELRQGGLLAKILYLGEFQHITDLAPDASDPAFDILQGGGSLMAFPLFERGTSVGTVVMLGSSPRPHNAVDLCTLATVSSLLGRAIETQKLANRLEVARRALDSELQAAADVQRWLLPPSTPGVANTSIAASYRPAHHSGGDYYDLVELPDGRLGALIADVSGKGAAAAVLMSVLRTILHEVDLSRMTGPAACLDHADSRLRALGLPQLGAFVTAFSCALDPTTGGLSYSSAGHNPPRLLRVRERSVTPLDGANAMPLGIIDEANAHTEETIVLMPGDLALLYTDGITEARSPEGEFFGTTRLDDVLRALPEPATPALAVEAVTQAVSEFTGAGPLLDDQTLLALGRCTHA